MDDEKDLDKKLAEFDQKVTPEYLLKLAKVKLAERILKGEVGLTAEFNKLKELEAAVAAKIIPGAASSAPPTQPASQPGSTPLITGSEAGAPSGETCGEPDESIGIPQNLRVKRHYTVTPAVIERNKKNAQQSRPGSADNKRNWKGGKFAKDFIEGRIKPCLSTCPDFADCELVSEGYTKPGGVCLDKAAVIATYSAIMDAIKHQEYDDFNEVSGLMIAEAYHVVRSLMEDVMRDGGVCKRLKYDKNGVLQSEEFVPHPGLLAIPKLIADLGINPREMNITPKAMKDDKNTEEANKTAAGLMSDMARRMREREGAKKDDPDE